MRSVWPSVRPLTIEDHYTLNVNTNSLPYLCMEQQSFSVKWSGLQSLARVQFRAKLWGFGHHEDPRILDDLLAEFSAGLSDVLNARHLTIPLDEVNTAFFNGEEAPLGHVEFGAVSVQNSVLRGFSANYKADVELQILPKP